MVVSLARLTAMSIGTRPQSDPRSLVNLWRGG